MSNYEIILTILVMVFMLIIAYLDSELKMYKRSGTKMSKLENQHGNKAKYLITHFNGESYAFNQYDLKKAKEKFTTLVKINYNEGDS